MFKVTQVVKLSRSQSILRFRRDGKYNALQRTDSGVLAWNGLLCLPSCHWSKLPQELLLWAEARIQIFESTVLFGAEFCRVCYINCNAIKRRNADKSDSCTWFKDTVSVSEVIWHRTRWEVNHYLRVTNFKILLWIKIGLLIEYSRGDHNVARRGFWCGSPLTVCAAPNPQEMLYYSDK
jgi:hypothetical protein